MPDSWAKATSAFVTDSACREVNDKVRDSCAPIKIPPNGDVSMAFLCTRWAWHPCFTCDEGRVVVGVQDLEDAKIGFGDSTSVHHLPVAGAATSLQDLFDGLRQGINEHMRADASVVIKDADSPAVSPTTQVLLTALLGLDDLVPMARELVRDSLVSECYRTSCLNLGRRQERGREGKYLRHPDWDFLIGPKPLHVDIGIRGALLSLRIKRNRFVSAFLKQESHDRGDGNTGEEGHTDKRTRAHGPNLWPRR